METVYVDDVEEDIGNMAGQHLHDEDANLWCLQTTTKLRQIPPRKTLMSQTFPSENYRLKTS